MTQNNIEPEAKSIKVGPINHERLRKVKAQMVMQGYHVRSMDDTVDLLMQVWDRAVAKRVLNSLVAVPK